MTDEESPKKPSWGKAGGAIVNLLKGAVVFAVVWSGLNALVDFEADNSMDEIENQVAEDFERQYREVQQYGTPIDICVRAGFVAEGHLQAGNSSAYAKWKNIEAADCRAAGM